MSKPKVTALATASPAPTTKIVIIGDVEVLVRRGADGSIRSVKATKVLSEEAGHIFVARKRNGEIATMGLTAEAYLALNQIAGLHVFTPPTVIVDGEEKGNPYVIRDPESHAADRIIIRKIALGRSPTGNLVAVDETLDYSPKQYLLEALAKKARWLKGKDKAIQYRTQQSLTEEELATRLFFPTVSAGMGQVGGYLVDPSNEEVMGALTDYQNKTKFAERAASTICHRRALSKHPAISRTKASIYFTDDNRARAKVPVVGWMEADARLDRVGEIAMAVSRGDRPRGVEIEVDRSVVDADELELDHAAVEAEEGGMVADTPEAEEEAVPPAADADHADQKLRQAVFNGLMELNSVDERALQEVCEKLDVIDFEDFARDASKGRLVRARKAIAAALKAAAAKED